MLSVREKRRLPGFRFETLAPSLGEKLPRMDIAVFVGFAASGPLHMPVAVEDAEEFAAIFGADPPLAWDPKRCRKVYAQLGPAVRSFFRNGGRRCWVIRVASGDAAYNYFPVPGLAMAKLGSDGEVALLAPATVRARSEGSWSDALTVSSALLSQPLVVTAIGRSNGIPPSLPKDSLVLEVKAFAGDLLGGDLIQLSFDDGTISMLVVESIAAAPPSSPLDSPHLLVNGTREVWLKPLLRQDEFSVTSPPTTLPIGFPRANKLTFELWARRGTNEAMRMVDLAFNAPHPRFWGDLPVDQQFYSESSFHPSGLLADRGRIALRFEKQRMELGQEARSAKFPFAGSEAKGDICFPIGMSALPADYLPQLKTSAPPLLRDGLATFDASLFLDPELVDYNALSFGAQADFLRYQSPMPRPLRGIHAAFEIEESTIIAVPDAAHVGWKQVEPVKLPIAKPSDPIPRPEWWHFRDCTVLENRDKFPRVAEPNWGYFLGCDSDALHRPILEQVDPLQAAGGNYVLRWSLGSPPSLPPPEAKFVLEESMHPEFQDPTILYMGDQESYSIYGRPHGDYFYRVRMIQSRKTSDWSNGIVVRVSDNRSYELTEQKDYSLNTLLAVHRALLRMGAARGDLFGVFSMPEHYREDDVISYVKELKSRTGPVITVDSKFKFEFEGNIQTRTIHAVSLPLSTGEADVFSHAALYHPWLIGSEPRDRFAENPPEGAACGVLAARALSRGAWIAPANEALRGPVALKPAVRADRWLDLQESNINIIRQDVRGFMALSADTLSSDDDLRPINVRRLLSLLRRLALRLGAGYVFEPNDASFRRAVQRGFEAMLGEMFVSGAFAGPTPQTSFQVVTSDSLNTPQSVDLGRFIVELRVAPSLPMTFMTIRLVQTGDRSFVVETR